MKSILSVSSFLIIQTLAAIEIPVGATKLQIPAPVGFSAITDEMKPYADLAKRFVPPTNRQFALFLPESDAAIAAQGAIPAVDRRFSVQTANELITPFISSTEFSEVKGVIKQQNNDILKKAEAQMPGFMDKINKGISQDYNVDLNLALTQMLPLPPHSETDRGMAYSTIVKYNITGENGQPTVFEGVVTTTFIHIQGKILYLYAFAEKTGLVWSRVESKRWADAITAANPSLGTVAVREDRNPKRFDWGKVGEKALIGAIIGGIVGLVGYLLKSKAGK